MKNLINWKLILILVLVIGIFFRVYKFGQIPSSMDWDEVAITYNAWSLSETAKDEYGNFLPMVFRSFDDYKPPLYFYLTVPLIKIFGPADNIVRIPFLILGILNILGTYLLVKRLFKNQSLAIYASFFMAISPWSIHFSRVGFEGGTITFFVVFGTIFFLKSFLQPKNLIISAFIFGVGLYSYHSAKLLIPLIVLTLSIVFLNDIKKISRKYLTVAAVTSILLIIPTIYGLIFSNIQSRYEATNIFYFKNIDSLDPARKLYDIENHNQVPAKIFHNKNFYQLNLFVRNYLSHFSPDFLFYTNDNPRHHTPNVGLILLLQLPLIILGAVSLTKTKFSKSSKLVLLLLVVVSPLASAVTFDSPHSIRSALLILPISILSGLGLGYKLFGKKRLDIAFKTAVFLLILGNLYFFSHQYFSHYNLEHSQSWQEGRKEAALFTKSVEDNYDEIWVSNKLEQSYIYWLLYQKINPKTYFASGGTREGYQGFDGNYYGKYKFLDFQISDIPSDKRILLVGQKDEFLGKHIHQIFSENNQVLIDITDSEQLKINEKIQ